MDTEIYEVASDMGRIAEFVVQHRLVTGDARGIAKQVVAQGWRSLSDGQREAFLTSAIPAAAAKCSDCDGEVLFGDEADCTQFCRYGEHE